MAYTPRKGVKRKHLEEAEDDISRSRQRQRIIDMSMGKLRSTPFRHGDPDPCLRRSVLILNTLKQIEAELQKEGVESHQSAEAARNEISQISNSQLTLDPLPDMSTFIYPLPASSPIPMSVDAVPGEGGDYVVPDSSVVDLMPAKPLAACPDQTLPQTSSPLYYPAPAAASAVAPSHSDFYAAALLDSATMSSPMYYETPAVSVQSSTAFYDSSFTVNSVLELLKMFGDGDSNNNNNNSSATKGPYTNHFMDENSLDSLTITEADITSMDQLLGPSLGSSSSASTDSSASSLFPSAMAAVRSHGGVFASGSLASSPSSASLRSASSTGMEEITHFLQEASDPSPRLSPAAVMTNTQCSTYCRSDSTLDDLDSIMQILVGM